MNKNVMLFVAFLLGVISSQMMNGRRNIIEGNTCGNEGYGGFKTK